MPARQASQARRFRTGRPCLDFAHTGGEGPLAMWELLHTPTDAERWLGVVLDIRGLRAADGDLAATRALRAAITRSALRATRGEPPAADDIAAVNAAAAPPPLIPRLGVGGAVEVAGPTTVEQALSTLARDAIDLFAGPLAGRIRVCAAPDCGLLFVDASRPGRRRWCSMQRCGNLAKKRTYRRKASPGGPRVNHT